MISKATPLVLDLGLQLAPWGPGWGLSLNWGLWHQKLLVGSLRLHMYTKKIRYEGHAQAGKRPSGGPAEHRECIGTRVTGFELFVSKSCSEGKIWCILMRWFQIWPSFAIFRCFFFLAAQARWNSSSPPIFVVFAMLLTNQEVKCICYGQCVESGVL